MTGNWRQETGIRARQGTERDGTTGERSVLREVGERPGRDGEGSLRDSGGGGYTRQSSRDTPVDSTERTVVVTRVRSSRRTDTFGVPPQDPPGRPLDTTVGFGRGSSDSGGAPYTSGSRSCEPASGPLRPRSGATRRRPKPGAAGRSRRQTPRIRSLPGTWTVVDPTLGVDPEGEG